MPQQLRSPINEVCYVVPVSAHFGVNKWGGTTGWTVTHMLSGRLAVYSVPFTRAVGLALEFEACGVDWEFTDPKQRKGRFGPARAVRERFEAEQAAPCRDPMTVKDTLAAMCDASDAGTPKLGLYMPAVTNAKRRKNGDTELTIKLVTNDLSVNDVLEGVACYLAIGRVDAIKALKAKEAEPCD